MGPGLALHLYKPSRITWCLLKFKGVSQMAQWERIHLPMQETQAGFLDWEDPLEKEMANHSSILAWRIP